MLRIRSTGRNLTLMQLQILTELSQGNIKEYLTFPFRSSLSKKYAHGRERTFRCLRILVHRRYIEQVKSIQYSKQWKAYKITARGVAMIDLYNLKKSPGLRSF